MTDVLTLLLDAMRSVPAFVYMLTAGAAVSAIALLVHGLAKRSSAAQRHFTLSAGVAALLIVPLVVLAGPELKLGVLPAASPGIPEMIPSPEPVQNDSLQEGIPADRTAADVLASTPVRGSSFEPGRLLVVVYLSGVLLVLIPLAVGILRLRWIVRHAERWSEEPELPERWGSAKPRFLVTDAARVPLVFGWRRPVVVVPSEARGWSSTLKESTIIHELAHCERNDVVIQALSRFAVAIHWFNPLAWVLHRRLLLEAEQACDDRVLDAGADAALYAEDLLRIASGADHRQLRALSAVAMARSNHLATRIEALFDRRSRSAGVSASRKLVTLGLLLTAGVLIGAVRLEEETVEENPAPSHSSSEASDVRISSAESDPGNDERASSANAFAIPPGSTVRVEGHGSIILKKARTVIAADRGGWLIADPGENPNAAEIVGPGSGRWSIERISNARLTGPGSRIRSTDRWEQSRVDSSESIVFYISVSDDGIGEYFQPHDQQNHTEADTDRDSDSDSDRDGVREQWSELFEDGAADASPLYAAIRKRDVRRVGRLLEMGADPNAKWSGDGTPLIIAVRARSDAIVDLLLDRGARPDEGVGGDGNALIVAARAGDLRNLQEFIATGADIDRGVGGDGNPLIAAAGAGRLDAVRMLLDNGANIETVVEGDENALITAAERGHADVVRYLISRGADVNSRVRARDWSTGEIEIRTPLSQARRGGHQQIVEILLEAGARE